MIELSNFSQGKKVNRTADLSIFFHVFYIININRLHEGLATIPLWKGYKLLQCEVFGMKQLLFQEESRIF